MSGHAYAAFLPAGLLPLAEEHPESDWRSWRGYRIHIARAPRAESPVRVLVIHGAGGHSGALWPLASLLAARGLDVSAIDLPLYGRTTSPDPSRVRYDDWVALLLDLIASDPDERPLILLGASIGGMLAYEVAARSHRVAAVAATCLLDPRSWRARARMTRFGPLGLIAGPLTALARGRVARVMIPMSWVADFNKMSRNPELSRMCATDPRGGAAHVPLGFLASYLRYRHVAPESMRTPISLLHPSRDAWTPVELSMPTLRRTSAPSTVVMLRECGHFPVEEPGLSDLIDAVEALAQQVASG